MAIKFGWCGLGQMGEAMTANMLAAKLPLIVWNRSAEKCEPIKALGAEVAGTPQEVFEKSDVVYVMLSTPEAAKSWWSENAKFASGKMVVDCATLGVEAMVHIAGLVTAAGGKFLEAPVAGHSGMAKAKTIQFLVAGDKEVFEKVGPSMDSMAKGKEYLGEEVGLASKMKLVVNSTLGNMMLTCAEGVSLSEKVGLDASKYLEIIGNHPALSNGLTKMFGPKMLADDHAPLFMTKHMEKDAGLALEMATAASQALPLTAASRRMYKAALDDGESENHMSAVYRTLKKAEVPSKGKGKSKEKAAEKPPPAPKKAKFGKIATLKPNSKGVNLLVKIVGDTTAVEAGTTTFYECSCGDASGTVTLSLTEAQKESVQKDKVLVVRNAAVKMVKGHIRLAVDKWGKLDTNTEETVETVGDKDVSATEYELVK
jgi:3-hydroxyisobutyrate dehydrogenase-like beta-hydroxyacid dehydrogenase